MDKPADNYWKLRLGNLKSALESNNFEVHLADDRPAFDIFSKPPEGSGGFAARKSFQHTLLVLHRLFQILVLRDHAHELEHYVQELIGNPKKLCE